MCNHVGNALRHSAPFAALAFAFGCGGAKFEPRGGPVVPAAAEPAGNLEPEFQTTVEAFTAEVLADRPAATAKYHGKVVELEGVVAAANKLVRADGFALLGAKGHPADVVSLNVSCAPLKRQAERSWHLGRGQRVKVVGAVADVTTYTVDLRHCTFVEVSASPTPTVPAARLARAFADDAGAAGKAYPAGSEVVVEGTVSGLLRKDNEDGFHVVCLEGTAAVGVQCVIAEDEWKRLKVGDAIAVKGDLYKFSENGSAVIVNAAFVLKKA